MKSRPILGWTIWALVVLISLSARQLWPAPEPVFSLMADSQAAPATATSPYETRAIHDPDGTGKFYMGREIAQVMGPGGIPWLDRAGRDEEEKPDVVIDALNLHPGEIAVDLGAGSGYFTFRMAPRVDPGGKVLAVEIQDEMIEALRRRAKDQKVTNVEIIKGSESDPHLPANSVNVVLMVDVYHELAYPFEVMTAVHKALRPGGHVVFVEYRKEDPKVQIKALHKMSVEQLEKEMQAVGLIRLKTVETLPLQHIVIFGNRSFSVN